MRHTKKALVWIGLLLVACSTLHAQDSDRINSNVGFSLSSPLNPTAHFTSTGWGINFGTGYNFNDHHSIIGEFMWNGLSTTNAARQLEAATQESGISGHNNIFAVTGEYRYQVLGKKYGVYVIGGAGWYIRTIGLSQAVTSGTGAVCTPVWRWWGFTCVSGTVTANQTIASYNSGALGGNAGAGVTFKVAEPSYRVYVESRYHYAPTKNFNTQVVDLSVGIRY